MKRFLLTVAILSLIYQCDQSAETESEASEEEVPFVWENANVYFLLTDRFNNGDPTNDVNFGRDEETAVLRGFEGGDIKGITHKIEEGYFDDLGINTIWFTPVVEQVKGVVDEGTGKTYGYHGYWASDWTSLDPNFGTEAELSELVSTAHEHGIRVLLDVVINHTGPITDQDPVWPDNWVRTSPTCNFQDYAGTTSCTLVENLPDIRTDSDEDVDLPPSLQEKWKSEGRYEQEMQELAEFFERTGYPKAPRYYIIKWLSDLIEKYGVDGFRVDTVKHLEESVWGELYEEAIAAFARWKLANPEKVLDDNEFYMVGEVYNYYISDSTQFNFGDKVVNFYDYGFKALINFDFKTDAGKSYEEIFSKYDRLLQGPLQGKSVLNYISSHDDGGPFDKERNRPIEAGTKLMLCPGGVQVYYGDETNRSLIVDGTQGDATLRSFMNWEEVETNVERNGFSTQEVLSHWQKLGRFRKNHPAVGAGRHEVLSSEPYVFQRTFSLDSFSDRVIVGLDLPNGEKSIPVQGFAEGTTLVDAYSGSTGTVQDGSIVFNTPYDIVLIED